MLPLPRPELLSVSEDHQVTVHGQLEAQSSFPTCPLSVSLPLSQPLLQQIHCPCGGDECGTDTCHAHPMSTMTEPQQRPVSIHRGPVTVNCCPLQHFAMLTWQFLRGGQLGIHHSLVIIFLSFVMERRCCSAID
jgi:hypothetical protein